MALLPPTTRRLGKPYRLLVCLLYSRFAWVERESDNTLTADTVRYARALGMRTRALRDAMFELKAAGYLDQLIWHQGWFRVRVACPPGWARLVGPSVPAELVPNPPAPTAAMAEAGMTLEAELV